MKKVLFLMSLLFLIGLGTASLSAQVRIGGNAAPNASALLDLNATDATNNGTKGLALPRVDLTSPTMLLSGVTSNLTGMMVYNTTTTLGAIGIYYWNGATWVKASLPSTSQADSGLYLISNGTGWVPSTPWTLTISPNKGTTLATRPSVTWVKILDTTIHVNIKRNEIIGIYIPTFTSMGVCSWYATTGMPRAMTATGIIYIWDVRGWPVNSFGGLLRCYAPSA